MKLKKIFLPVLTVATSLFVSSCEDRTFSEFNDADHGDEVTVSFMVAPEAAAAASRAEGDTLKAMAIGDGSKCDVLIYAVYDEDGNLLEQYGRGVDPELEALGFKVHETQSAFYLPNGFPATVNITFKRGSKYHVAFWAQSSKCNAYNTLDLKKVEIIYGELPDENDDGTEEKIDNSSSSIASGDFRTTTPNNDEYRDAFCRSVEVQLSSTSSNMQQNVYLYRPLAQINVGTVGYDYEVVTRNAIRKYTYSKIRINRVARYLDVVTDRVYNSTTDEEHSFSGDKTPEAFAVVDFGYAPIPAYANRQTPSPDDPDWMPDYPSFTIHDWLYDENFEYKKPHDDLNREQYEDEQFLRVKHLDDKSRADANVPTDKDGFVQYANLNNYPDSPSETFKYLSMCYVLTSSTKDDPVTINNIKVWLATDADGSNEIEILNVNHVPAQRNWRTNIVGTLLTEENKVSVSLDRDFAGEYNAWTNGDDWEWSGPLAEGVFYNAAKDQIEISSADGLIWFQRMVNGDLTIRETYNDEYVGQYYYSYFDEENPANSKQIRVDGIKKPSDPILMKRILKATHQDVNTAQHKWLKDAADHWPDGNRFHFCGQDQVNTSFDNPAKVVLMSDIDLTGIEWIPIGFESKISEETGYGFDGSFNTTFQENNGIKRAMYCVKNSNPYVRGFFGIFDGNNHTITNLTTKRSSMAVPDWNQQHHTSARTSTANGLTYDREYNFEDCPQWFGHGLFGQIFLNAKIRNVRLVNVDIKGCHGVGGICGLAYGFNIEITNCHVDGGSLVATPLLRGDRTEGTSATPRDRTYARGVYTGGIVGYFNTRGQTLKKADGTQVPFPGGKVDDCSVRNLYIQGYRRLGGLVGSVDLTENDATDANNTKAYDKAYPSNPASFINNYLSNVIIVASSYSTFGSEAKLIDKVPFAFTDQNGNKVEKNVQNYKDYCHGFGFTSSSLSLLAQPFVGGDSRDLKDKRPSLFNGTYADNLTFSELKIDWHYDNSLPLDPDYQKRVSTIRTVPLKHMPIFSGWFVDKVTLNDNFYGEGVAKKIQHTSDYAPYTTQPGTKFKYPMTLPDYPDINWANSDKNATVGMYVDGIELNGEGGIGNRSVITPDNVMNPGAATMFVTARNLKQFWDKQKKSSDAVADWYKKDISISNVVLRGAPYAYTGMLVSPNENVRSISLYNVAIYDCFQTIALDDAYISGNYWPNKKPSAQGIPLNLDECNLRGYTVPGAGWQKISYKNTTFEAGSNTGHSTRLERTCKVEAPTDFSSCSFKAPYYIDLSAMDDLSKVVFVHKVNGVVDESVKNVATSTSKRNVIITLEGRDGKGTNPKCATIAITSNAQGDPVVTYLDSDGHILL